MRERELVALIERGFGGLVAPGALALSDDAALLPPVAAGATRVVTTDMVVEGRDFALAWGGARSAGLRAMLQNVSDLSAMGAVPVGFTWALAIPRAWTDDLARFKAFIDGAAELSRRVALPLFGGDLSSTDGPFVASVTAFGDVEGAPLLRSGARPGDGLFVAGPLGASRAGLARLRAGAHGGAFVRVHLTHDDVDLTLGPRLVGRARAAMDLSDGLLADLPRLCRASRVGAVVDDLAAACARDGADVVHLDDALAGGEDYHLLFTLPDGDDGRDIDGAVRIGRVTAAPAIEVRAERRTIVLDEAKESEAFDHFGDPSNGGRA